MSRSILIVAALAAAIVGPILSAPISDGWDEPAGDSPEAVLFSRDILPILSDTCFPCHGPDGNRREADLRLDRRLDLLGDGERPGVVVPGDLEESELFRRITSDDEGEHMPPPEAVRQLDSRQIELIRAWIEQGAVWQQHWSFATLDPPRTGNSGNAALNVDAEGWPVNSIDQFVLRRLIASDLRPSPPEEKARLLRRVTLDLTGLPPTLAELDAFLEDSSPDAYERVVDRLLASPRYGERMAWEWLEAARYADTNGYQGDGERTMWPWRDWVVDSLNANLPYDDFSRFQIAGDLLPEATFEQRLATGFCRNHMINGEGGRIPEENRAEYVFDQIETVRTVWMGLTYQCCRCHDHKYDPLAQEDYYQLFAIFNQTPIDGSGGNAQTPPVLPAPDDRFQRRQESVQRLIEERQQLLSTRAKVLDSQFEAWREAVRSEPPASPWHLAIPDRAEAEQQQLAVLDDASILAGGDLNPERDVYTLDFSDVPAGTRLIHLEALQHASLTERGLSRADSGNFVLTALTGSLVPADGSPETSLRLDAALATFEQNGWAVSGAIDDDSQSGWAVWEGRVVDRPHAAVFQLAEPLTLPENTLLRIEMRFDSPHLNHHMGRFRLAFSGEGELRLAQEAIALQAALAAPSQATSDAQRQLLVDSQRQADPEYQEHQEELQRLNAELQQLLDSIPQVMIMADRDEYRPTFVLDKGLYNRPLREVRPGLPPFGHFADAESSGEPTRRELADWILDPANPLTARVTVNRIWQTFFGAGLVATPEDFGSQGDRPSHPELLDWLAMRLIESGWDVKAMHRLIVLSATYRQTARVTPELLDIDPENRLLSRGPRYRMPSWMLRDAALFQSRLLVDIRGGAPVRPYQPPGVWEEATFGNKSYVEGTGSELYRRSLYTFWRRIVGPTIFFDVAKRQTCSVGPYRTNTPLHALHTMNDPTYVEAARVLAQRLMDACPDRPDEQAAVAFRVCTSRPPDSNEMQILLVQRESIAAYYRDYPEDARSLLSVGESSWPPDADPAELATLTGLCLMIQNLDESLSK